MRARPSEAPSARAAPRDWLWLTGILVFALALRVVYVLESRANPYFAEPQMDAAYHLEWARAFAAGHEFQPGPFFRAPLYPWFLGSCIKLFGENLLLVRLMQALIGTFSCALVYAIAARVFERRTARLAALFAASYWILIYFDGELLLPVLEVPTSLLAIWTALRWRERPGFRRALVAGAALGLAAIVRPNVLVFAPLIALWMWWSERRAGRARSWAAPALFAAGALACVLPITLYNGLVGGDWVLVSSQAGVNLWIGNNPSSDGSSAIVPGTRPDWWGGYWDAIHQAEAAQGRELKPSEVSSYYTGRAVAWARSDPLHALLHQLWKLRLFFLDWEFANNQDEHFFALHFAPLLRWLPLGFGLIAPLALIGMALRWRRAWSELPLWGFVPVYTLTVVAFFVNARFRVPVLPVLMIFAASACVWALDAWRGRQIRALASAFAALIVLFVAGHSFPAGLDRSEASGWWQLGNWDAQHDDLEGALEKYDRAIAENPRNARAQQYRARMLQALGRMTEARASLDRALAIEPANPEILMEQFELARGQGHWAEAEGFARLSIERVPQFSAGHYNLGRVLFESWINAPTANDPRLVQALAAFERALALRPEPLEALNAHYARARTLAELARGVEAVDDYRTALDGWESAKPPPEYWDCANRLVALLRALGRDEEVRELLARLQRSHPGDPRRPR